MYQQILEYLENKSVLILGFGREGRSTYGFIRKHLPEKKLTVADAKPVTLDDPLTRLVCGAGYMDEINSHELVIKSPGIPVKAFSVSDNVEITCQTDLFVRFSGCRCVGITGTKGKTTASTLTYLVLKAAGIPTCLIGNIGVPVLEAIEESEGLTPVIEMSSHQLEFCHSSPHIAVLTNIYEEHLDHYNGMAGYVNAKLNIFRHQSARDHFIYTPQKELADWFSLDEVPGAVHSTAEPSLEGDAFLRELSENTRALVGRHNKHDVLFAACVGRILGATNRDIERGISSFEGIPHRMEFVGCFNGVGFYNDAIATIPHAVMCGVEALPDLQTLIIGGMDRGLDYTEFEKELDRCAVDNLLCLPETGHKIGKNLLRAGTKKNVLLVESMEEAVEAAYDVTRSGHSCLLSPAASSYNRYKSFEQKGDHYKALVRGALREDMT